MLASSNQLALSTQATYRMPRLINILVYDQPTHFRRSRFQLLSRIKQYVHWIATDPEFFTIPACIGVNCLGKMVACIQNEDCKATLDCTQECQLTQPRNKQVKFSSCFGCHDQEMEKDFLDEFLISVLVNF